MTDIPVLILANHTNFSSFTSKHTNAPLFHRRKAFLTFIWKNNRLYLRFKKCKGVNV